MTRSHPCSISQPWSDSAFGGALHWGPSNCRWVRNHHLNRFWCTGVKCAKFCEDLTLQIKTLGQLLELEGTGGAAIPYLMFVEVNVQILGIRNYSEDVLLLIIPTTTYSETVLVMVSFKIINKALSVMTMGELAKATMTWQQVHFGAVMSRSLQPSCGSSERNRTGEGTRGSSQEGDPVEVWKFSQWC